MNANPSNQRYQRQISLKGFGPLAQQKLQEAKVLVIGAGGLGCPALQYLAGAGVGEIGIVDGDTISLSNLHRQVLYATSDIGLPKAHKAAEVLRKLNPEITIMAFAQRLSPENGIDLLKPWDIILDCTDNFASRYMINDACVLLKKVLVYGAVSQYEGQLALFNCLAENPIHYRHLFPEPPKTNEILNCEEAGVLGVLPGIIGTMMANETIKWIAGIGETLLNTLLIYNSLDNRMFDFKIKPGKSSHLLLPKNEAEFRNKLYENECGVDGNTRFEISVEEFNKLLDQEDFDLIDVREMGELPAFTAFPCLQIPLSQLTDNTNHFAKDTLILFCQSGKRSNQAAAILSELFGPSKKIHSLQGGIIHYLNKQTQE